jgi:hypothetical protein
MAKELRRTADFPTLEHNIIREELNKAKVNEWSVGIIDESVFGSIVDC